MKETENLKLKTQNSGRGLFLLGLITFIYSLFRPKASAGDMKRMEFSASTQKMGISFTDKIRNVFRHRWLKIK
jgi:hypothetical protein